MNKVRKFKTQMAHKAASSAASASSPAAVHLLISGAHEAKELLGQVLFAKLEQHCWTPLKEAGFTLHVDKEKERDPIFAGIITGAMASCNYSK